MNTYAHGRTAQRRTMLAMLLVMATSLSAFATNYYWLKSGGEWGHWSDPGNWSLSSGGLT